jgi:hypothetical protein
MTRLRLASALAALGLTSAAFAAGASGADDVPSTLQNRSIAYVTAELHWAVYQTPDGKAECPDGFTTYGPREMFKDKFPNGGALVDTQLRTEADIWFPHDRPDASPFREAKGPTAIGLNLDGKNGPNDFTSPDGERGIDNQLYRAIGCSLFFRGPDGTFYIFGDKFVHDATFNRTMIEITNVDDLRNDPDVDVTFYRGLDKLMTDATGDHIVAGGSQRIDTRFGKRFERHMKGKIVDGVLTTEPADVSWPWTAFGRIPGGHNFRALRFKLKLTPTEATGLVGAYDDVDEWYTHLLAQSTHHLSYGQLYGPALNRVLHQLADGYPGKDGVNTAISLAMQIQMAQVFVVHPAPAGPKEQKVATVNSPAP